MKISEILTDELFGIVAGETLGGGLSRWVYSCRFAEDLVIKLEHRDYTFQNVAEWELWQASANDPKLRNFLAPCIAISPNGRALVQRRTYPVPPHLRLPRRVPAVLSDLKRDNWGHFKGRVVCHDYGFSRFKSLRAGALRAARFGGEK